MSQAGILNSTSSSPTIPTQFTTDSGIAVPAANNLNVFGGTGIATSGAGSTITITVVNDGFTWTDVTSATQTLAIENGYVTDRGGGVTYTLPATALLGNEIQIVGKLGAWIVNQNANQQILLGSSSSTIGVGGSIASTNVGDCVTLICITAGASTVWRANSYVGNLTIV